MKNSRFINWFEYGSFIWKYQIDEPFAFSIYGAKRGYKNKNNKSTRRTTSHHYVIVQ